MKTKILFLGLTILAGLHFFGNPQAWGYQEAQIQNGATLQGSVLFKGEVPPPKKFELAKFPQAEFCGQVETDGKGNRVVHEVSVKDGRLRDVVVFIEGIEKGKPWKFEGTEVQADLCRFLVQGGPSTFVDVVENKGDIRVTNLDADPSDPKSATGVLHNPHGYEVLDSRSSTMFNVPLPEKGMTIEKTVKLRRAKKGSFMKLECDQHNFMVNWFHPVDNPYYAIVGENGQFSIEGIPPGTYEVYAWHPILGKNEQKITLDPKGTRTAQFEFSSN